jgi:hypothetical protein
MQDLIESLGVKYAKRVRHMENVSHDPEGQRVKKLMVEMIYEFVAVLLPPDDGTTTHLTKANPQLEKVIKPVEGTHGTIVGRPAQQPWMGLCEKCHFVHDLRGDYDHISVKPF